MPLQNHYRAPLYPTYHWESFHSHWASVLTNHLNGGLLPEGFFAAPYVKMGVEVEIDVAAFEKENSCNGAGSLATAVYAPPWPVLSTLLDFTDLDSFEIQIRPEGSARLAAAIEFISPANKDRPGNRRAFAIKCASYLHQGAALLIVDMVTTRKSNLHKELLDLLAIESLKTTGDALYTAAYRTVAKPKKKIHLQAWLEPMGLDKDLPTLPLWLTADCLIPIDLEKSYCETGELLRLPGF